VALLLNLSQGSRVGTHRRAVIVACRTFLYALGAPGGGIDGYFDVWVVHGIFIRYFEQNLRDPDENRPKLIHEAPVRHNSPDPENSLPQLAFGRCGKFVFCRVQGKYFALFLLG
jgi:hypothetical protein